MRRRFPFRCYRYPDQAFAYIDKEYATGGWYLSFLKVDPDLDPLRADPRFKEML